MDKRNAKAWLYLLPALFFLGVFMIYPLVDVVVYSLEENFNSVQEVYTGVGLENFSHVLRDVHFLRAVKNTFILVVITVPVSTGPALLSKSQRDLGTLEAGKLADLVVLDRDLFTVPKEEIKDIPVVLTMVGGRVTFDGLTF